MARGSDADDGMVERVSLTRYYTALLFVENLQQRVGTVTASVGNDPVSPIPAP